jgi:hypothetical protein
MLAASVNIFGYYAIGITVAVYLGFKLEMGVFGQWIGITSGSAVVCVVFVIVVFLTDWKEQARKAQELAGQDKSSGELLVEVEPNKDVIEVELQEVVVAADTSNSVQ